ncbi:MAG: hypothetical protein ABH896_04555 [Candidatus Jacksonbacteria bacterium]
MIPYSTKSRKLHGTSYSEIRVAALILFDQIKKKSQRKAYIRSAYFNKQKVFLDYFWAHLFDKSHSERVQRLKFFAASLELIRYSRNHPISQENPHKKGEILHRFAGLTKDKELFYAQIKESKRNNTKYFMSCFPAK